MAPSATYHRLGQSITRLFVAGVLLLAATLKFLQLLTPDLPTHRLWHLLQVEGELLLATWLLSGLLPRAAFAAAIATFLAFAAYSLHQATSGATSCGCFGRATVNPWLTLTLDAVIIILLLLWFPWDPPPAPRRGAAQRSRRILPFILLPSSFVLVILTSYLAATYRPGRLLPTGQLTGDPRHVSLTPSDWINHPFPLTPYLTGAPDLRTGRWNLMFVRHNCPLCHAALDDLRARASAYPDPSRLPHILLIELPPYGPFPQLASLPFPTARLRDDREWTLPTPTVLKLHDGTVTSASRGYLQLPTTAPTTVD